MNSDRTELMLRARAATLLPHSGRARGRALVASRAARTVGSHRSSFPPTAERQSTATMPPRRAIVLVFLPFVSGYYLSYLFRTINALISAQLTAELGINAADLGLLTSVYFLTFAAVQLPLGILLDRYGPRRMQSVLLLIAACGAALFASGHSLTTLMLGRALIGIGVAAALMAGLKGIVLWFPKERLALVNGWFVMLGALGALTATEP